MKTNIKRRTYQTINRKNQKAMWKLLLAVTLGGVTAILSPFAVDVLYGSTHKDYFPKVIVHAEEEKTSHKSILVPRESDIQAIERVAKEKCAEKGLGDFCWKDLVAMAYTESRFNCKAVGDGGKSHGCFQIHLGYHKHITVAQAQDIEFSLSWTLDRLVAKGYPMYRSNAVMLHNGTPNTASTKAYLQSVNNYANSL